MLVIYSKGFVKEKKNRKWKINEIIIIFIILIILICINNIYCIYIEGK